MVGTLVRVINCCSSLSCSCWLSLEGGLLYAFVGPAAAVVLVGLSHGGTHQTNVHVCEMKN